MNYKIPEDKILPCLYDPKRDCVPGRCSRYPENARSIEKVVKSDTQLDLYILSLRMQTSLHFRLFKSAMAQVNGVESLGCGQERQH